MNLFLFLITFRPVEMNVTPFGRILSGVREGDRFKKTATFTNYIGAGREVSD